MSLSVDVRSTIDADFVRSTTSPANTSAPLDFLQGRTENAVCLWALAPNTARPKEFKAVRALVDWTGRRLFATSYYCGRLLMKEDGDPVYGVMPS